MSTPRISKAERQRQEMIARIVGPQRVGGRYFCGYWRQAYTVLAIEPNGRGVSITSAWDDGSVTTHCTAWDARRDKVIETNAPGFSA